MTVQITTLPAGTVERYSNDPTNASPPLVPAGSGVLQFQDVLPDGSLGPIWGPDDLQVVEVTGEGLRLRFPDGTEIILEGTPQEIAGLLGQVAPAVGDDGGTGDNDSNGSSGAFNFFVDDGAGSVFGVTADGTIIPLADSDADPGSLPEEDANVILTLTDPSDATDDTATPAPPTVLAIAGISEDTGTPGDGVTSDNDLLVSGTALAGSTVELFLDGVTSLGTAVADGSGNWSIQTAPLAEGAATLTATATDAANNTSAPSAGFDIVIDTIFPGIPLITGIADDSGTPGDGITNDNDLLVSGTAEAGATVELFLDGATSLGTAVVDGSGNWSIQTGPIGEGPHRLSAGATDLAGNTGDLSFDFNIEIDTTAPDAPSIVGIADDTNTPGDGITSDNDLLVSGTAEIGATVELFLDGATSLGTAVADGLGNWSIQTGLLPEGAATLTATATDVAGNPSGPSAGFAIEIDTSAPGVPTIVSIADDTDTPGDGITSDNDLLVSGTAEAGATVELFLDGATSLGTAVADGLGNWSIQTGVIAVGAHVLTARATDLAGNTSAVSADFNIEIQAVTSVLALSSLDGSNGFVLPGVDSGDFSGVSVSDAGDVNGDGFEDVIIGTFDANGGPDNAPDDAGESYVVFGRASGFGSVLNLSSLDGSNGFLLAGIDEDDYSGFSVSGAGDVNGDGFADLIVGAVRADSIAGESYVVFGKASGFGSVLELSALDGSNGFLLSGIDPDDGSGVSVSGAGDVNGDGFADLIIGAGGANGIAGETYVVFGGASGFGSLLELSSLDGSNGFQLSGIDGGDISGFSVSGAGDVNGDGLADLIVGAVAANGTAGESYVVFGRASGFGSALSLSSLDGSNGFLLSGIDAGDYSGLSVSGAGDLNGDGLADVIVGAPADEFQSDTTGEAYVVFGRTSGFASQIAASSLDGTNGFLIAGIEVDDEAGVSVSGAGDVNGDGLDDLIIGAQRADGGPGNPTDRAGESYVVFGRATGFGSLLDLSELTSEQGFIIAGIDPNDGSGLSVSGAGDVNGDGFADLIIGAYADGGPGNPASYAGESYIIFGGNFTGSVSTLGDAGNNSIVGFTGADVLIGAQGNDTLQDVVPGFGPSAPGDVLYGGEGDDTLWITNTGFLRVDGGTGTDTLVLNTPTPTVDLTAIADSKLTGIERIDLNAATNTLILSPLEVLNLSDTSNRLVVFGASGDEVQASGDWLQFLTPVNIDGIDFIRFTSGAAELLIQVGVTATLNATPVLQLSSLDGANGFVIAGIDNFDISGRSVSGAGDVNGDGFADVIIGALGGDGGPGNPTNYAGESYVVFGKASGFGSVIDLSSLDGSNGFVLAGIDEFDTSGRSVSGAGDVNGDGFADLIVGADQADGGPGNLTSNAGESYVVFGRGSGFGSVLDLSSLDGSNGFLLAGIDTGGVFEADYSGVSVSGAGDVNGDGFADLIVGTDSGDGGPGNPTEQAGESYVIFGRASGFGSVVELSSLDGSNGFLLAGIEEFDESGFSVSGAGDVNGDGFADLIVGARFAEGGPDNTPRSAGESYVVFGRGSGFGSVVALSSLDGSNGFVIAGIDQFDNSGGSVSGAGDVNGDGFADLIVSARFAYGGPGNSTREAGESYVVFGKASGFGSVVELSSLDGSNGFVIAGIDAFDESGISVSGAGDVNGDGFDDIIIGAENGDGGPGNPTFNAGESYLVFGRASGFGSLLDLDSLTADQGFVIAGIDESDDAGRSVSGAGDVNGDGFADLIVGVEDADGGPGNPTPGAGESYIIFGGDFTGAVDQIGDAGANTLTGGVGADVLLGAQGNDVLDGNGGADVLYGGEGDDEIRISDTNFQRIDGGSGTDTLVIDQPNTTVDLTQIADSKIQGIEQFDLNFDSNTLILSPLEVLNLSDTSNRLVVFGEPGDTVQASGEWLFQGFDTVDGVQVAKYASGAAQLWIQTGVAAELSATIALADLGSADGASGFVIAGIDVDDGSGYSVSDAGDVNGDGFEDVIIGTIDADGGPDNLPTYAGESYLVFGRASGFGSVLELSSLDGSNGFVLAGIDQYDASGISVSGAGDVNGDGFADLIVGAFYAEGGPGSPTTYAGESYVVFGKASGFGSVFELSSLDGSNGFVIAGIDAEDYSGVSVSGAGDVNGDGFADLIVGAYFANGGPDNAPNYAGESYVVFGAASGFGSVVELSSLDGSNGFIIAGIDAEDYSGVSVSGAGDVNGDGLDDLIIGAFNADGGPDNAPSSAGESYVVFGAVSGFGSVFELSSLDGSNGFVLAGIDEDDRSGISVSGAGDVNGDGFADLIVGTSGGDGGPDNTPDGAGESYVVFGAASGFGSVVELSSLGGSNGFVIAGIDEFDDSGFSVSGAGDVNGDGLDDLIIGARNGDGGPGNPTENAGESYLVFGRASGFGSFLDLSSLTAEQGFVLAGIDGGDNAGFSVSGAGDLDGDGFADLIIGARNAAGGPDDTPVAAGESYVIFGGDFTGAVTQQGTAAANSLTGTGAVDVLLGAQGNDVLDGNGGADVLYGGEGDDEIRISDANFQRIDGGTGTDTLVIDVPGTTLDLTAIADSKLQGIEQIDLNFDSNTLILSPLEVLNLSDTSNRLVVFGEPGDTVQASGEWLFQGFEQVDGVQVAKYASGAAQLWIQTGVAAGLSATIDLADLGSADGASGFVIAGIDQDDTSSRSVSGAGDVNGDGFADIIIGGRFAEGGPGNPTNAAGESYVVFGKASGFGSLLALSSLDGSNGFILAGIDEFDRSGFSVSGAGDVNGDGLDDVIVGALFANGGPSNPTSDAGESYVVFGKASGFGSVIDLSSLDGSNGFVLSGIDGDDNSGRSVSGAGDVNGDGFADLIIGADSADGGPGNPTDEAGESYLVFGRASGFGSVVELSTLDGSNGFLLAGIDGDDYSSFSVSGAGDVNGDGFADLIVGAFYAEGGPGSPTTYAGESYVVFGKASGFGSVVALSSLDGSNGFVLAGIDSGDTSGFSVSGAGDVNGDGFADLIIGAIGGNGGPDNTPGDAGESYVVFGKASGFGSVFELSSLDGSNGFVIPGIDAGDRSGFSVSGAGDVNGDGLDDLVIGARDADGGPGNPTDGAGESYLVFGRTTGFGSLLDLDSLTADQGFVIAGIDESDDTGRSVSGAGDLNGDGFADLIVGAYTADGGPGNPAGEAGESYVIYGGDFTGAVSQLGTAAGETLTGTNGTDVLLGAQGNDVLIGGGGADVLYGGEGDDILAISDAALQRLKGGTGTDTLRLDGAGLTLDLTALSDLRIEGIEIIDLQAGAGNHDLTLDLQEVLNLSDSSNTLTILGDADDTVAIGTGWTSQGVVGGFETFTQGAATLVIAEDIVITP